jgi:LuxR family maltose regulon positive regulatory protein
LQPWIAAVRATMGKDGVYQMIADAESALAGLPRDSQFRPSALIALGIGSMLLGQNGRADGVLATAASEAERLGATDTRIVAVTERSLIAAARADQSAAETFAVEARELTEEGHLEGYATSSMALAVAARTSLRHGRWDEARALLGKVQLLRERLTRILMPWLAIQALIEEARAYLALRDTGSVQSVLGEIRRLLREHPYVGLLVDQAGALEHEAEEIPQRDDARAAGLTAAELRLLPYLATHLSFREIGEALYVSRNTVKTQAISVYRKLGVTSRSEAITRAVDLGLVELGAQLSDVSPRPDDSGGRPAR